MSYEIVKSIRVQDGKVFTRSSSNNVYPKSFNEWECKGLTELLQEEGITALNLAILKEYEDGNFQPGTPNKWSRAIDRLRHLPEYEKYNWRNKDYSNKKCPIEAARQTKEFDTLLLNSLNLKPSSEKYIVKTDQNYFVSKVTTRRVLSSPDKNKAKIFPYKTEADRIVNMFPEFTVMAL